MERARPSPRSKYADGDARTGAPRAVASTFEPRHADAARFLERHHADVRLTPPRRVEVEVDLARSEQALERECIGAGPLEEARPFLGDEIDDVIGMAAAR